MIFHEILSIHGRLMKSTIAHNTNSLKENYKISTATLVGRKINARQKIADKGESAVAEHAVQSLGPDDSAVVYVDDFRPTTLGKSPRVGHSFTREKDVEPKQMDGGDRHVVAASSNDSGPQNPVTALVLAILSKTKLLQDQTHRDPWFIHVKACSPSW
ncbi:hypothetical protein ACJRO7_034524 [Eucalyptus globulus]|uniref:Uncharacterized protein n=1 Tax=Eucalyptus globulus TaxID=34317 RepID=A0ABD3JDM3_EUCGL